LVVDVGGPRRHDVCSRGGVPAGRSECCRVPRLRRVRQGDETKNQHGVGHGGRARARGEREQREGEERSEDGETRQRQQLDLKSASLEFSRDHENVTKETAENGITLIHGLIGVGRGMLLDVILACCGEMSSVLDAQHGCGID
jgi:hypothetical protein